MFIDSLEGFKQYSDLELDWCHDGMDTIPGYLITCTDGHTYLCFAPDMDSLKHMHVYRKVMNMAEVYMSDHMYDPLRKRIRPAFCHEKDEWDNYKVFYAPASEIGKIYLVK